MKLTKTKPSNLLRKVLLGAMVLLASPFLLAQNGRYDSLTFVTGNLAGVTNAVLTAPGAAVSVYQYPGIGLSCLSGGCSKATTYADQTTGSPCGASSQVTVGTSNSCGSAADSTGNFGFWAPFGKYQFCLSGSGLTGACYNTVLTPDMTTAQTFPAVQYTFGGPVVFNGAATFNSTLNVPSGFAGLSVNVSGTGCGTTLSLTNTDATPTLPHKYFRVNQSTGALELMNSGCTSLALSFDEAAGILSLQGNSSASPIIEPIGTTESLTLATKNAAGGSGLSGHDLILQTGAGDGAGVGGNLQLNPSTGGVVQIHGIVGTYANVQTAENGQPAIYFASDLVGQTANIGSSSIYSVPNWSVPVTYRASCYMIVTTIAGSSSTLPTCTLSWTDKDNSVVQTLNITATNGGNTTTTFTQGVIVFTPKPTTAINFSTTNYASNPGATMQYSVHFRLEAI